MIQLLRVRCKTPRRRMGRPLILMSSDLLSKLTWIWMNYDNIIKYMIVHLKQGHKIFLPFGPPTWNQVYFFGDSLIFPLQTIIPSVQIHPRYGQSTASWGNDLRLTILAAPPVFLKHPPYGSRYPKKRNSTRPGFRLEGPVFNMNGAFM